MSVHDGSTQDTPFDPAEPVPAASHDADAATPLADASGGDREPSETGPIADVPDFPSAASARHDDGEPRPLPQIRVRGRSFMALVLSPEPPLADWVAALDLQIAKSAPFFAAKPVILDCGLLQPDEDGLRALVPPLLERGIRLSEIEGADPDWPATAGWTWPEGYSGGRAIGAVEIPEEVPPPPPDPSRASLVIDEPVRSGRIISFPDGDVVVLGSVASGAEVSAGGSIHVYGALRGRAFAGVGGNANGRILCRRLHAELIAIGGLYMTADDLPSDRIGQAVHVRLDGERLMLLPLD